ncbi:MAG: RluA family pseudouridine synthase [Clostridia bacterium]|nr:RluA family pseudouridine synthase [Clostridia bacterium]MBR4798797.1 RluA family pseudouridine synthase [Clostridia bacterium]
MTDERVFLPEDGQPARLDVAVSELFGISRARSQELLAQGNVRLNGTLREKKFRVSPGDRITAEIPESQELQAVPQDIPVDIVYEDEHLLVVDKPRGMVVHPAAGNPDGTLVNALLFHCRGRLSSINGVIRPGIVHRIDKDTSGLLIVAKTDEAHRGLAEQIAKHTFTRRYEAIVGGRFKEQSGTVDAPIGRHKTDRKKMAVTQPNSKPAVTHWRVISESEKYTRVECTLETGRTHQIRVHMAYIGHPVAGDAVYGSEKYKLGMEGQCLFAKYIAFTHPVTGEPLAFEAPLPEYFKAALKRAGLV